MGKSVKFLTIAALALFLAQPALYAEKAKKERGGERPGERSYEERGMRGLGLTDEQQIKISNIKREFQKKMLDYRETLAPKAIHLKRLLLEDNVDIESIRPLVKEIAGLRAELQLLRIQMRLAIDKILTPEQKARMRLFREHRRHMMMMHRQMMSM